MVFLTSCAVPPRMSIQEKVFRKSGWRHTIAISWNVTQCPRNNFCAAWDNASFTRWERIKIVNPMSSHTLLELSSSLLKERHKVTSNYMWHFASGSISLPKSSFRSKQTWIFRWKTVTIIFQLKTPNWIGMGEEYKRIVISSKKHHHKPSWKQRPPVTVALAQKVRPSWLQQLVLDQPVGHG